MADKLGKRGAVMDALRAQTFGLGAVNGASGTAADHGALTGLGDDDHSQYVHISTARTITAQHSFSPGAAAAPFVLGANAQGQTVTGLKADQLNKSVVAGNGLTGGGYLTADATLSVDTTYAFTWTGLHTFNAGLRIAAGQSLQFSTDVSISRKAADIAQLGSGDAIESPTYTSGLQGWRIDAAGDAEFNNVRVRGELVTAVFTYNEISATAGTFGVFKSAGVLTVDWTSPATLLDDNIMAVDNDELGGAMFAVGDILWIKGFDGSGINSCWLTVTARTIYAAYTSYTVLLNSGSTSKTFYAGTGIADYGPSGTGAITLSADGAIGYTPNISLITHAGSPWTAQTLRVRIGNLNGSYGQVSSVYGIGVGDYSSGNYLRYESSGGFLIKAGNDVVQIDSSGIMISDNDDDYPNQLKFGTNGRQLAILPWTIDPANTAGADIAANRTAYRSKGYMRLATYDGSGGLGGFVSLEAGAGVDTVAMQGNDGITLTTALGSFITANTSGLVVDQDSDDGIILQLKSSDVAHGVTDFADTDVYGFAKKLSAAEGGLYLVGLSGDASPTTTCGIALEGVICTSADATHSAAGHGVVRILAARNSGTNVTAIGFEGNLLTVENAGAARLIVDAEGDLHIDGTQSSYDDYDDIALVRGFEQALVQRGEIIDERFRSWLDEKRAALKEIGILSKDPGSYFYNVTRLQRLQNGAIGQLAERLERVERLLNGK